MFLRNEAVHNSCNDVGKKIKSELFKIFKQKGINVSDIYIDMKEDNVNIRVCISKDSELGMAIGSGKRFK